MFYRLYNTGVLNNLLTCLDGFGYFRYIEDNRFKSEYKNFFRKKLLDLEETVSSLSHLVEVMDLNYNLRELQGEIFEEGNEIKGLVDRVILTASNHIVELRNKSLEERDQVLESIPDRAISLVGISLDGVENSPLETMLESVDEDDISITEYSLKDLCGKILDIPNQQLSESIEIAEKLIESLKDKERIANLIAFCSKSPSRVKILFSIVHYLALEDFQNKHLESFNKVFPGISLDQAPETITQLDLSKRNTAEQFNAISPQAKASIEHLNLKGIDITDFDFSGFTGLRDFDLLNAKGLTVE